MSLAQPPHPIQGSRSNPSPNPHFHPPLQTPSPPNFKTLTQSQSQFQSQSQSQKRSESIQIFPSSSTSSNSQSNLQPSFIPKVSSQDEDEDEYGDDEEWVENAVPKGPREAIEVFHKTHYNDTNDHYNDTNGWTSKLAETRYNEMIALQKEQQDLEESKCLSGKEICAKELGKLSACAFSFKPTTREELEAKNEQLKSKLQEMNAAMTSVKDMQKVINQLQDFQKRIEGASPSTPTDASMD